MKFLATLIILFSGFSAFAFCKNGIQKSISYFSQVEYCAGNAATHYVYYERYLCKTFNGQFHYEYKIVNQTMCQ